MSWVHPWSSLAVVALGILWRTHLGTAELRIVCYYTNWSVYRPGTAKFSPQNINPYLCTHLVYAFGGFTKENTFKPFDKYQDIEKGGYSKFTGLKTYNKELKTLIAIGGWNEGSSRFSAMVANSDRRREFVKNSVKFLRQNHFDGLDLDWEYPSFRDGGKPHDKGNYANLVQELREEYDRESEKTNRSRLLLTMAVPAGIEYINKGYDIPRLMKYLDWMNVLSYDYHSAFEPSINHHAPLYSLEEESEYNYDSDLNINHTIQHYLELGAERDKIILGIPTYGRSYTLFNPDAPTIGDAADGPGEMGEATRENGYLSYYEICERIKSDSNWIVKQPNPNAVGPYAYKENQWVGYDDENIIRKKAEYVVDNRLGGIMFWSVDNDDFRGNCHGRPYPLIEAAKEALIQSSARSENDNTIPTKEERPRVRNRNRKPSSTSTDNEVDVSKLRKRSRNQDENKKRATNEEPESIIVAPKRRVKSRRTTTTTTTTTMKTSTTPRYQTPEPPSTPDPGGDFKCEDEGFFPHPRDCKKYFWCLNGPSETGIIAHHFTCPSGLHFNKLTDSCDYAQNVLCSKKPKTTAATTSTTTVSTTTYSTTSKTPISTTTRAATTTPSAEEEYEDEYIEDIETPTRNAEEDPRVIKELIDLIKKAGGIEELEKQLKLNENGDTLASAPGSTTTSTFNKSLYERILANRAKLGSTEKSSLRNNRGPQFEQSNETPQSNLAAKRVRPQYKPILRQHSTTKESPEDKHIENVAENFKPTRPDYKLIGRSRPSTTVTVAEVEISGSTLSSRYGDNVEEKVIKHRPIEYVTLRRSRPTTAEILVTQPTAVSSSDAPLSEESLRHEGSSKTDSTTSPNNLSIDSADISTPETISTALSKVAFQIDVTTQAALSVTVSPENVSKSSTPHTKVSDSVSPRNVLRSRHSGNRVRGSNNVSTQRIYTITDPAENYPKGNRLVSHEIREPPNAFDDNTDNRRRRPRPHVPAERSKNYLRRENSRFSIDSTSEQQNSFNDDSSTRKIIRPKPPSEQSENSYPRNSNRYVPDEIAEYSTSDDSLSYGRKFRPDITAEISDLSSLTSADLSSGRSRYGTRRTLVKRISTTTEEVQQAGSNAVSEVRKELTREFNINRQNTQTKAATSSSTVRPNSRSAFQRRRIENISGRTTENSVLFSKPTRRIYRRLRVTSTTEGIRFLNGDESLPQEEEENIKLSESKMQLNSLDSDNTVKTGLGKQSYNKDETNPTQKLKKDNAAKDESKDGYNYGKMDAESNLVQKTRKFIHNLDTGITETPTTSTVRTRKIIRRLRPAAVKMANLPSRDTVENYEIPINQKRRKVQLYHNTNQDDQVTSETPRNILSSTEYLIPSRAYRIVSRSTQGDSSHIENAFTTVPSTTEQNDSNINSLVETSDVSNDLSVPDLASTLAAFASIALEYHEKTSTTETDIDAREVTAVTESDLSLSAKEQVADNNAHKIVANETITTIEPINDEKLGSSLKLTTIKPIGTETLISNVNLNVAELIKDKELDQQTKAYSTVSPRVYETTNSTKHETVAGTSTLLYHRNSTQPTFLHQQTRLATDAITIPSTTQTSDSTINVSESVTIVSQDPSDNSTGTTHASSFEGNKVRTTKIGFENRFGDISSANVNSLKYTSKNKGLDTNESSPSKQSTTIYGDIKRTKVVPHTEGSYTETELDEEFGNNSTVGVVISKYSSRNKVESTTKSLFSKLSTRHYSELKRTRHLPLVTEEELEVRFDSNNTTNIERTRHTPKIKIKSTTESSLFKQSTKRYSEFKGTKPEFKEVPFTKAELEDPFVNKINTHVDKPKHTQRNKGVRTTESPSSKPSTRHYELKKTKPVLSNTVESEAKISRNKLFANRNRKINTPAQGHAVTTTTLQYNFTETTPFTTTTTTQSLPKVKKVERLIEVNRIVEVSLKENKIQKHHPAVQTEYTRIPSMDRIGAINRITEIKVVDPEVAGEKGEENAIEHEIATAKAFTVRPNIHGETSTISLEALFNKNTDELLETQNAHFVQVRILEQDNDRSKRYRLNGDAPILPIRVLKAGEVASRARVIEVTPRSGTNIKIAPISLSFSQRSIN